MAAVLCDSLCQLLMIDQRDLPAKFDIVPHTLLSEVVHSIKIMLVRGAPAIGAAGGERREAVRGPAAAALFSDRMHSPFASLCVLLCWCCVSP